RAPGVDERRFAPATANATCSDDRALMPHWCDRRSSSLVSAGQGGQRQHRLRRASVFRGEILLALCCGPRHLAARASRHFAQSGFVSRRGLAWKTSGALGTLAVAVAAAADAMVWREVRRSPRRRTVHRALRVGPSVGARALVSTG